MKEERKFEENVRSWVHLEARVRNFYRENTVDGRIENEAFSEILPDIGKLAKLEADLVDCVSKMSVVDDITDPMIRSVVLQLIRKSQKSIDRELKDDPLEMEWDTECQAWDDVYDLVGTPKELLLKRQRVSAIVALAEIPERVRELLEEARTCYVTNQRNAVMALGRMMLEFAVTDIGVRMGLFPEPDSVDDFYRDYPPYERADLVLGKGSPRRKRFRDLYRQGSQAIHSSKDREQNTTADFLEEVIKFIGETYTANHRQLRPV